MLSEPIALPILDTADVLLAAYEQLTRFRAYIETAREITRGSSTPRPAGSPPRPPSAPAHPSGALHDSAGSSRLVGSTPCPAGSAPDPAGAPARVAAALVHAADVLAHSAASSAGTSPTPADAFAPAANCPAGAPPTSTLFFLSSPSPSPSPFSERHLFLPIPLHLRLTPLSLTLHATLPIFYAERPLLGIDSRSLVILTRDLPSRHRPPSPCAFATVHLPADIDPSRCTAAFHHGSLGIRMLRAHPHSAAPSSSALAASFTTK